MLQDESLLEIGETYKLPIRTNEKSIFFDYSLEGFSESGTNAFLRSIDGLGAVTMEREKLEEIIFPLASGEIEKI